MIILVINSGNKCVIKIDLWFRLNALRSWRPSKIMIFQMQLGDLGNAEYRKYINQLFHNFFEAQIELLLGPESKSAGHNLWP